MLEFFVGSVLSLASVFLHKEENMESGYQHEFDQHLSAFTTSSDRVRYILIVIVLSSIFVFTGVWNSNQDGWALSRLKYTRLALQYELWNGLPPQIGSIPLEKRAEILNARKFIERRDLTSREATIKMNEALQAYVINHIAAIQIPFLGVNIDVNDLGVIGGFGFVVIIMWLAFSLRRLHSNMELSLTRFNTIEHDVDRLFVYNAFVMSQVLNTPPTLSRPVFSISRYLPRSLFCLSSFTPM